MCNTKEKSGSSSNNFYRIGQRFILEIGILYFNRYYSKLKFISDIDSYISMHDEQCSTNISSKNICQKNLNSEIEFE